MPRPLSQDMAVDVVDFLDVLIVKEKG